MAGIAVGLVVMIISVAIVAGFKQEIRQKVFGFGSHIQILNHDDNYSYETSPVSEKQEWLSEVKAVPGVSHVQVFATKPGIIKTKDNFQGVILKGIAQDFDWTFFDTYLVEGKRIQLTDTGKSKDVIISRYMADILRLKTGDPLPMYFIQDPPRMRKFEICGIYETHMEDFDKMFVLVDIKQVQKLNDWSEDSVSGFEVYLDDFDALHQAADQIWGIVGYRFDEYGGSLKVQTIEEKYPYIFDWIGLFNTNLWVILVLMVIVAGFNMISSLLIMILERTSMVGILKAMGAGNPSIRNIFLYHAAILTLRGLFWGNLIGISLCLIQYYFRPFTLDQASYYVEYVPVILNPIHILLLNLGTMVITLTMLLLPSMVVSRISPVKAIKFD